MARKKAALFMTVGTGVGEKQEEVRENLAHGMLFSIDERNPDKIIFFGSEKSKLTIEVLKKHYRNEYDDELDIYEFIQIDNIDNYEDYFNAIKSKIEDYENEYKITIDYTSGTKTMTMSAALASMLYRKKLIVTSGERKNGTVIRGTEKIISQNLFPIYDNLTLDIIKNLFDNNRFESAKSLLDEIVDTRINKEIYEKLLNSYSAFDNVKYNKALENFELEGFQEEWPELSKYFLKNIKALKIINKETHGEKQYYILASLLNNARRRYEENKYDDAIARLYRSLELIGQIKLQDYKLESSDIDVSQLKNLNIDEEYIAELESTRTEKGQIKIGLEKDFELLSKIENDEIGKFYTQNKGRIKNYIKFRNESILAHGMESKSEEEYIKFRDIVLEAANVLTNQIDKFINETKFPEFNSKD